MNRGWYWRLGLVLASLVASFVIIWPNIPQIATPWAKAKPPRRHRRPRRAAAAEIRRAAAADIRRRRQAAAAQGRKNERLEVAMKRKRKRKRKMIKKMSFVS